MRSDWELIREYVDRGDEEAFRLVVERHAGMVMAVAARRVRDPIAAQDIAQAVFLLLARKATVLDRRTILAGWLHRTTLFVAKEALRAERRRQEHQAQLARMETTDSTQRSWDSITPWLDEILSGLVDSDRSALVLRYLEEQSFAEVAAALGVTEAAAKMRVGRAIEKLRAALGQRGIELSSSGLAAALTAHGLSATPPGLPTAIASAAMSGGSTASPTAITLLKESLRIMTWNKIKTTVFITVVILLLGTVATILATRRSTWWPRPIQAVHSLEPLSGEWVGTYTQPTGTTPNAPRKIELSIRTSESGDRCEIDMRMPSPDPAPAIEYHFVHSLDAGGRTIHTKDDLRLALLDGKASVTEAMVEPGAPEWRVAFELKRPAGLGVSSCLWVRRGDELTIDRFDSMPGPQGMVQIQGQLRLRKIPTRTKAP